MRDYLKAVREHVVVYDGGMGATLEQFELTAEDYGGLQGKCHEALVLNRPDVIEGVHASMLEAGAEVVETDTFQASRLKLDEWGLADYTVEVNTKAAEIARKAAGEHRFVAGSIGPTGFLPASEDPTLGQISFGELVEVFTEQAEGLIDGGVDLLIIETAQDILEVKAAVFGARAAFKSSGKTLPIHASVSLLPNGGKMLLGTDVSATLCTLEALTVSVVGLNCSTGPQDMRDAIRFLGEHCSVPVACIPNAGLPLQGPDGETIFPEEPEPLAEALEEFVERYGVGVVGGCCGTTPDHIRAISERVGGRKVEPRPAPRAPHLSSMIAATSLVQEPRPTMVGERVNSQGSRKAKELLLADDYDGLVQIAEDQVAGGAHVLDLCVALTERADEDEQMRLLAKRISLTQEPPIQIDSTEPEVIERALEQIPGRAIVNSVNLEAGRDKLDRVVPVALAHGAALIALTIDEVGMAKTAQRKVEIAERIKDLCCEQHGLDPKLLIFDCLTFTLTTGDEEWRPSAVETIEGIKRIKAEVPDVKTSLGVSNVSFGVSPGARAVLNSVFLHHCVEAGLDLAMVNPNHITPYSEITDEERGLADDLVFNRREDALEQFIAHFESKGEEEAQTSLNPTEGMEPEEALHFHILRRRKEGVEDWIDASVEKIGAVPTLNGVLLPAMKEVGDKFGAGELILPFVLQSAEVMKKAVARLENYLDKIEGYTKGTVVLATVFGDVHDIGKSLVNTILTNNGYTVIDLGKQVPIQTILDAAREHEATAIGLSALLVSTSKQMPACIQELHSKGMQYPVLIGGAAINRAFSYRALYPGGKESDEQYEPGVFYCKDAFEGLSVMDQLIDTDAHTALLEKLRTGATEFRAKGEAPAEELNFADDSVRSDVSSNVPIPIPPWWGVQEVPVNMEEVYSHLDTHVLFKLHWGGKGVKGEAWRELVDDNFRPRLERMWSEQDYLHPRALLGFFPCYAQGNDIVVLDPRVAGPDATPHAGGTLKGTGGRLDPGDDAASELTPHSGGRRLDPDDPAAELTRFVCPRQPKGDRICLADFFRPAVDGKPPAELDVIAVQAVTVGSEVTELMAKLETDGEFAEQLFVHGLGVQTAEGLAEWLHWRAREMLAIPSTQGRRYSWGYPAVPEQAEHLKVEKLLNLDQIGMTISDGYAPIPEQSTLALVAHHPQAIYFGTRQGRLLPDGSPDDVIKGSYRDPSLFGELDDVDPSDGSGQLASIRRNSEIEELR